MPRPVCKKGRALFTKPLDRDIGTPPHYHDQIILCDDTPNSKIQLMTGGHDLGLRVQPTEKARMRRLSYDWLEWSDRQNRCKDQGNSSSARVLRLVLEW